MIRVPPAPAPRPASTAAPATVSAPVVDDAAAKLGLAGRALWDELHGVEELTPQWLASWRARIPRFGCSCVQWFDDLLKTLPPVYGSGVATRRRGWEWHDAANAKLGKPRPTFEEVAALRGWPLTD
jgi:hypothetical protein